MLYNFVCDGCGEREEGVLMTLAKMEEHKKTPCKKCGEVKVRVSIDSCPGVFYMGDGWTNAWKQSSRRGTKGQQNLDAALRENDALQYASTHDPKFIRAGDVIKRKEDETA